MYKAFDMWLPGYVQRSRWQRPKNSPVHILFCVCDHFEPLHDADKKIALERIALWKKEWPELIKNFTDADGVRPRHTFFYPIEQYDRDILASIAELCSLTGGEVEIH